MLGVCGAGRPVLNCTPPAATPTPTPTPRRNCVGDCDGNHMVGVDELVKGVNIAIGAAPLSACTALDANMDGAVTINELIEAVNAALTGCS